MENKEEKEVTLGRVFKVMFHNKLLLVVVSLVVLLIGVLGIKFVYNSYKAIYKAEYKYNVSSLNNDGSYIDGTKFYYKDVISESVLNEIKESNELYSSIDVEKMLEKDGVSIDWMTEYNDNKEVVNQYYQLTFKQVYFSSEEQAKSFISDVMNYPLEKNKSLHDKANYSTNLTKYNSANTYSDQISYLSAQYSFLHGKYESLIADYGDLIVNEKKLSLYLNDLEMFFTNNKLSDASYELVLKGYVKNYEENKDKLELQKDNLQKKYDLNETIIAELKQVVNDLLATGSTAQSLDLGAYNSKINELIVENAQIKQDIEDLNIQILNGESTPTTFTNKLNDFYNELVSETLTYKSVSKKVINENSTAFTINTNIIEKDGGISGVVGAAGSLILGIVVAGIVNLIHDNRYLYEDFPVSKKKKELEPVEESK